MNDSARAKVLRTWTTLLLAGSLAIGLAGCPDAPPKAGPAASVPSRTLLQPLNLSDPIRPSVDAALIELRAAQNEWTSFALQISDISTQRPMSIRVGDLTSAGGATITAANIEAYQILPMPVQVNPGYVRHTGLNSANRSVPRALLAVPAAHGIINLASLRDPTQATNPSAHPNGGTVQIWVDLHVPQYAAAGGYTGSCELSDAAGHPIGSAVPVKLAVFDFALPEARHLQMVGELDWERLGALYPELFGDTITPNLMNRGDPRYRQSIAALDQMMSLSHERRAALVIPGLRPTVKWPAGAPPEIDWREFDELIRPWMSGKSFADRVPLQYWPLPGAQSLDRYDPQSRLDYWGLAAGHFDQLGWLERAPVWLGSPARAGAAEPDPAAVAHEASRILAVYPKVSVAVPLRDDQLARQAGSSAAVDAGRIITTGAPLVSSVPPPAAHVDARDRRHWMRTDLPGLVPYAGAGADERDVRVWAWLAFLRRADLILWDDVLPTVDSAGQPADPNTLTWFYPGKWFGVPGLVPTIQLEWLRRAQQDYEYLWLAAQRGEVINALQLARLITKPVEIRPGQAADPEYALLTGTASQHAWQRAQELLAETILLRKPGEPLDPARQRSLYIETLQWAQPQERPQLLARGARWTYQGPRKIGDGRATGNWVHLDLGLDVYNASDATPDKNALAWGAPPPLSGWEVRPQPVEVPRLQTYHVQPATLPAEFDLSHVSPDSVQPLDLSFINGFTKVAYPLRVRAPVAVSDRREGPLALDGNLSDWTDADALQDGPLVLMMNRPNLQAQALKFASGTAKVYSGWGRENFYLAFSLDGLSPEDHTAHNDVYYQARRAWGEDLCEVLIQPVYKDNSAGPVLHLVFKPNGADWVERKGAGNAPGEIWRVAEGSGVRYATTTGDDRWRGEAGIPWRLINSAGKDAPVLLRFNFCQHRTRNCESASWCGPVDFGRDESLMGVLYLRSPDDHLGGPG
jgi:hypothetical protein